MSFLLFDAYGTLAELDDFYNRLQRGFAARGFDFPMDVVTHAAHREMRYYIQHSLRAHQNDEYVTLRAECAGIIADTIREHGHELPLSTDDVIEVLSDAIVFHLFPETRETLQALHERGVRMGVLSNWDYQLSGILEDLGIAHFFDFVLSSAGVGYEKPAPEFFALGLEEIRKVQPNIALSDCYYIGDHYEKDVIPARAAGITPLWLVRDARDVASGETHSADAPVQRLNSLGDLLPLFAPVETSL